MYELIYFFFKLISIYEMIVIAAVVASWLVAFNVINTRNEFVYRIVRGLEALTEPLFARIRRVVPPFGGLDLSPIILLILLELIPILVRMAL